MKVKLFERPEQCCGCSACTMTCPMSCITLQADKTEGFLYPVIDRDRCIECGACMRVCPLKDQQKLPENRVAFAMNHADEDYRYRCTSAGAFEVICRSFCGGEPATVFGVVLDETNTVKHCAIGDIEALHPFRKSKYVQSELADTFRQVKQCLHEGKRVVFSGSPCQVDGLKHYLKRDYENLLLVDFVCHGVPSPKVFRACISQMEQEQGSPVRQVIFRNKVKLEDGWNCLGMEYVFENGHVITEHYPPCTYMTGFLSNLYLRPSCHTCKYASISRVSDITLGDSWGMDAYDPNLSMRVTNGTSLVMLNTPKGNNILGESNEKYTLTLVPIDLLPKAQRQLKEPAQPHRCRSRFFALLPWVPFSQAVEIAMRKTRLTFYRTLLSCWLTRKGRK